LPDPQPAAVAAIAMGATAIRTLRARSIRRAL
jgi:hypothetical protein